MKLQKKPYLIIPKLIEQPTWGGDYILKMKEWSNKQYLADKKIGQSYELFNKSKLLLKLNDSEDPQFIAELGVAHSNIILNKSLYKKDVDYIGLEEATKLYHKILLIKINQASGNSFQLHIKTSQKDKRWNPKPESWYYFEDGLVTFGIKKGIDINQYKDVCKSIEGKMKELSTLIKNKSLTVEEARKVAKNYIQKINPWQYVNLHEVKKGSLVDPSMGGIHHSWEENRKNYPLGNVLYEIQKDVMDPVSTIRAFDQGKIADNGDIREIHIDDYFKYIDTDPNHNDLKNMMQKRKKNRLLTTDHYCLDIMEIKNNYNDYSDKSYTHLFVKEGDIFIKTEEGKTHLTQGHSCFIPENSGRYVIESKLKRSIVLKTFVPL